MFASAHHRFLTMAAIFALSSTSLVSASASASPSNDATAIGAYLSLGFANAPTYFRNILGTSSGPSDGMQNWSATAPDSTHFDHCTVWHFQSDGEDPEQYLYTCYSVPHDESAEALFATVSSAVQQSIPAGYTVGDTETQGSKISQLWSANGSPSVGVEVKTGDGRKPFYELTVMVYPTAN